MTRANARELAVHLIYSRELTGQAPEQLLAVRLEEPYYETLAGESPVYADTPKRAQRRYLRQVLTGVTEEEEELNRLIQQYSIGWDVGRISRVTRAVLQLAIYEIRHMEDVPTGVAISEAVRLAKMYDGDDTGAFVNGILGTYARSLSAGEEQ